jgi:hypothetical protein
MGDDRVAASLIVTAAMGLSIVRSIRQKPLPPLASPTSTLVSDGKRTHAFIHLDVTAIDPNSNQLLTQFAGDFTPTVAQKLMSALSRDLMRTSMAVRMVHDFEDDDNVHDMRRADSA